MLEKFEEKKNWKLLLWKTRKIPGAIKSLQEGQWAIFLEENIGFCKILGFKRRRKQTVLFVACLCKRSDAILGKNQAWSMWKKQWWGTTNHSSRGQNKGIT